MTRTERVQLVIPRRGLLIQLRGGLSHTTTLLRKLDDVFGGLTGELVDMKCHDLRLSFFDRSWSVQDGLESESIIVHLFGGIKINFVDWFINRIDEDKRIFGFSCPSDGDLVIRFKPDL
ncbi:MAG: hypothetical protein WCO84_02300 [bacterium]